MTELEEYLSKIKSKNGGPFKMSITLFFEDKDSYNYVKESGEINEQAVANLYEIPVDDVLGIYSIDQLNTMKVSMKRPVPSGSFYDSDLDGSQQHIRMLQYDIPSQAET